MKWLDKIPYAFIVPLAVVLALAPFAPEPHLWEKLKMLFAGTLARPSISSTCFCTAHPC